MIFKNLSSYQSYLEKILGEHELNLSISDIFSNLLGNSSITKKSEIDALIKGSKYNEKDLLLSKIVEYLDMDFSEEDEEIFNQYIASVITQLDESSYINNPYYQRFKNIKFKEGKYSLKTDTIKAYELCAYLDMSTFKDSYIEKNSLGYFVKDYSYLTLNENDVTWMSVIPNEIETMKESINAAKGDIVVFGLGLGYFAYMTSIKKEVTSITIIEKDHKIIEIFNKLILPHFEFKNKIKIVESDAFEFCHKLDKFDYAFVDLWHDTFDGLELFVKFKQIERKYCKTTFNYWLESSFYLLLRRCMFTLINEQLEGYKDNQYLKADNYLDKVINKYYFKTKKLSVSSKEDLDNLLSDKTLINLLLDD